MAMTTLTSRGSLHICQVAILLVVFRGPYSLGTPALLCFVWRNRRPFIELCYMAEVLEPRVLQRTRPSQSNSPATFRLWAGAHDLELRFGGGEDGAER
jgi:hypothetical protein